MLPGMEMMGCSGLAVPAEVMQHVVKVESSFNHYAIGVVGGHLVRQPQTLLEAVATARMLEQRGYNFSLGLAQVNRYNLSSYGIDSYEKAFDICSNLVAGSRILADCYARAQRDWGKAFSCYYSGNFVTGFRHGYVHKVVASMQRAVQPLGQALPIAAIDTMLARRLAEPARREGRPTSRIVPEQPYRPSGVNTAPQTPQEPAADAPVAQAAATPFTPNALTPVTVQLANAAASNANTFSKNGDNAGMPRVASSSTDDAFVF